MCVRDCECTFTNAATTKKTRIQSQFQVIFSLQHEGERMTFHWKWSGHFMANIYSTMSGKLSGMRSSVHVCVRVADIWNVLGDYVCYSWSVCLLTFPLPVPPGIHSQPIWLIRDISYGNHWHLFIFMFNWLMVGWGGGRFFKVSVGNHSFLFARFFFSWEISK